MVRRPTSGLLIAAPTRSHMLALARPHDHQHATFRSLVSGEHAFYPCFFSGVRAATLPAQPARLRDLRGQNARNFHVRALPRRDGVALAVYPTGRGPKLRQRERDLRHHRQPPPSTSQAPLSAGRCGSSRRRTERFSFGQRHDAPLARALFQPRARALPPRPKKVFIEYLI